VDQLGRTGLDQLARTTGGPDTPSCDSPVKSGLISAVVSKPATRGESSAYSNSETKLRVSRPYSVESVTHEIANMPATPAHERLSREKRVLLSPSEETAVNEFVQRLSSSGAGSLRFSHLLRACIRLLRHCESELIERVRAAPHLVRPANDNSVALARFECCLAEEVAAAICSAPPLWSRAP